MSNSEEINRHEMPGQSIDNIEGEMTFLEHLEEFRWVLFRSVIAFAIGVAIVCFFLPQMGNILQMPLRQAYAVNGIEYTGLVSYKPMGVFLVVIQIALLGGFVLSMPFVLYFLACFITPGLTERERKIVKPACFTSFLLFVAGIAVAYFFLMPITYTFLVRLNQIMGQKMLLAASEHYNTVVWFSITTGVTFQFPLVLVILIYIQVITVTQLRSVRRPAFAGIMIFAALLTPGGDVLSLSLTTLILYGLYELAIIFGSHIEKKARAAEFDEWNDSEN
jgi:sec-independent protein translocase protein TatC